MSAPDHGPSLHAGLDAERWLALNTRQSRGLKPFVVGVISSGLYHGNDFIRRLPRRSNVCFFDDELHARNAGFRPSARNCEVRSRDRELRLEAVASACAQIEAHEEPPRLSQLARGARLSQFHFQRVFTELLGLSPAVYARALRERRVREALGSGATVTKAIYDAGFNSPSRFYEVVQNAWGLKPTDFRRRGSGLEIGHCVLQSPFGPVLAANTARGTFWLEIADNAVIGLERLQKHFQNAKWLGKDEGLAARLSKAIAAVAAAPPNEGLSAAVRVRAAEARLVLHMRV